MERYKQEIHGQLLDGPSELTDPERNLLRLAREAMDRAYAPYSGFRVGAALCMADGAIVTGNNQENAAFPSGLCAERIAFFAAGSAYPGVAITDLAIVASSENFSVEHPVAPCGACRQVMLEYELNQDLAIRMIFSGDKGRIIRMEGAHHLLPLFFHEVSLRR